LGWISSFGELGFSFDPAGYVTLPVDRYLHETLDAIKTTRYPPLAIPLAYRTIDQSIRKEDLCLNNSVDLSTDSGPVTPVVADFNGDGKLDLATVTGDNHGGAVAILLQQ
jgi:hypothetical protein